MQCDRTILWIKQAFQSCLAGLQAGDTFMVLENWLDLDGNTQAAYTTVEVR